MPGKLLKSVVGILFSGRIFGGCKILLDVSDLVFFCGQPPFGAVNKPSKTAQLGCSLNKGRREIIYMFAFCIHLFLKQCDAGGQSFFSRINIL